MAVKALCWELIAVGYRYCFTANEVVDGLSLFLQAGTAASKRLLYNSRRKDAETIPLGTLTLLTCGASKYRFDYFFNPVDQALHFFRCRHVFFITTAKKPYFI